MLASSLFAATAHAQNATWLVSPGSNDFDTAANWNPAVVPTGTATFGASNTTSLTFSAATTVDAWTFSASASNYNFNNANALTFSGAGITVNGGSVAITNTLSIAFINSATAGNVTITNPGVIAFQNSANAGSARIDNTGLIDFADTTSAAAAVINSNSGGLLQFRINSTAGGATITTGNGSSTTFADQSSGGTSRQIVSTGGVLDISFVSVPGGLAIGSLEGGGAVSLGRNRLTVGGNGLSTTFSGVIQDGGFNGGTGGNLVKVGSETLTLSGANTYTGMTTVNGGTLMVNGSIGSSTVNSGGILGGTGTVGTTQVNAGGIFAPGSGAPGTSMTVASLAFQPGAIYQVQVNSSTTSFANVTGAASLAGTVQAILAPGSFVTRQFDILRSGGLNGTTFSAVTNLPGFGTTLSYSATDVFLNLTANLGQGSALNVNQQNVATSINNFFNSGGSLPPAFLSLFGSGGASLGNGLTQLSGEGATASQQTTFQVMDQFIGLLTDPFMGRGDGINVTIAPTGYAEGSEASGFAANRKSDAFPMFTKAPATPFVQRWSVWAAGFGGSQSTSGDVGLGSNGTTSRIAGTAVGADYLFSPDTLAGFALAGGGTSFALNNFSTGRSDFFQAGAYVRHTEGPAYITAALAYGWQDITTNRTVTIAGTDQFRAEFNANAYSGRIEGGYRFIAPWVGGVGITPYAAGQFTTFDLPAYAETAIVGTPAFALNYGARSVTDARSELGLRSDKSFAIQNGVMTLRGRLAWAHDFDPNRSIGATFQALPGASFVVNGARQASDSALTTASAEMRWTNGWSAAATFEGEFSSVTRSYAGKGAVRYVW